MLHVCHSLSWSAVICLGAKELKKTLLTSPVLGPAARWWYWQPVWSTLIWIFFFLNMLILESERVHRCFHTYACAACDMSVMLWHHCFRAQWGWCKNLLLYLLVLFHMMQMFVFTYSCSSQALEKHHTTFERMKHFQWWLDYIFNYCCCKIAHSATTVFIWLD